MKSKTVSIGKRKVGPGEPVFIIAEAGVNHNGDIELAKRLVDAAARAGADAVKFQLYRLEEQISSAAPTADYQRRHTGSHSMKEMARSYDLPWESHRAIAEHCRQRGILYLASCFDPQAVDFFLSLGGEAIKVGSGEITNYPLLVHIAACGKPILLSTGMSTLEDIKGAVEHLRAHGAISLVLLHCVSNYPVDPATVNLRVLQTLSRTFHVPVGYSDHTLGSAVAVAAVALGACVIEKHFTLDKTLAGPDHAMSLDPEELRVFVEAIRTTESALGEEKKQLQPGELSTQNMARRSLVSARLIRAGEKIDRMNVTLKRPATGLDPRLWDTVLGRAVKRDIPEDVPITWEMLV